MERLVTAIILALLSFHLGAAIPIPSSSMFDDKAGPVNTVTGNFSFKHNDLYFPGRGIPVVFARSYNSQEGYQGPMGLGWTHSYNIFVTENADGSATVKHGDGHEDTYVAAGGGTYTHQEAGVYDTLVKNTNGTFTLTTKEQDRYQFAANGLIASLSDRNGNTLTFTYGGSGKLTTITDTVGRTITLAYDGSGHLTSLSDSLGRTVTYQYDASGNLVADTDPRGGVMRYTYDQYARLLTVADRAGHTVSTVTYDLNHRTLSLQNGRGYTTTFAYDTPAARTTTLTDARGGKTLFAHDELQRLVAVTDPLNHAVQLGYDSNNNLSQVTDRNGRTTRFSYDSRGNLLTGTDAAGGVTTIEYDANNNPTRVVDALNHATLMAYDTHGNLIEIKDALGRTTRLSYDSNGLPVTVTDARGNVTTHTYDSLGNRVNVRDALGHETTFSYNPQGLPQEVRNAKGQVTAFTYDSTGNLLSVVDPLNHSVSFTYDGNGNRLSVTDPRGNQTLLAYDEEGQLKTVTNPLGQTTTLTYDEFGNRKTVKDARNNTTTFDYDNAENLIRVTDALGKSTQFAYDANGNLSTVTKPLGQTTAYAYDVLNRLTAVTDALGHQTQTQYDAQGRITRVTDAAGRATGLEYDALGRLTKVTDAAGGVAEYAYDETGNRIAVKDPHGGFNTFAYDALNQPVAETDGIGHTQSYSYDELGNLTQLTDAKGQTLAYAYDAANRLGEIRYPDNTKVSFSYDAAGNRIGLTDNLGNSVYEYDALSRLARYTDPFNKTVRHEYDAAGNRTGLVYPDGKRVDYAYDSLNRLQNVTDWLGGVTRYAYDDAGRLIGANLPNGLTTDYAYDSADRLVSLFNRRADGSVLAGYELTLDAVGNRTRAHRVEPLSPLFQKKTETALYDSDNRLLEIGGGAVSHDANGNLTAKPGSAYQYDFEDRLIQAQGLGIQDYRYDGEGNRLQATRDGSVTRYTLDVAGNLSHVLAEHDASDNPRAYSVHGLGLIARVTPAGEARYYHYDPIGSTVALTDINGQLTDSYAYDPFGQVVRAMGTADNPFRFVGQFGVMDEGNGLNFMRARYYAQSQGRFINKDMVMSMDRYGYAQNNPVRYIDPLGLFSWDSLYQSAVDLESFKNDLGLFAVHSGYAIFEGAVCVATRCINKKLGIDTVSDTYSALESFNSASKSGSASLTNLGNAFFDRRPIDKNSIYGIFDPYLQSKLGKATTFVNNSYGAYGSYLDLRDLKSLRDLDVKQIIGFIETATFIEDTYNKLTGKQKVKATSKKMSSRNGTVSYEITVKVNGINSVIKATGKSSSPTKSKANKAKGSSKKSTPPKYKPKPGIVIPPPPPPPPNEPTRSLTITDPSPGEEWDNNVEHTINWVSENIDTSSMVRVYYSLNDGATWHLVNEDIPATPNDGSFRWSMWRDENICHDTWARVRIISVLYPSADVTSAPFYIDYKRDSNSRC